MISRRKNSLILWTPVLALALMAAPGAAIAGAYPSNKCASAQLKAAGKKCKAVLGAWSGYVKKGDVAKRDGKLDKAETKFTDALTKAEEKATKKGVTCALTQELDLIHQTFSSDLDTAIAAIVEDIQDGLTTSKEDKKCGASLLKAAAGKCDGFLKAESKLVGGPAKDPDGAKRAASKDKANTKFSDKWGKAGACNSTATEGGIGVAIETLTADAVENTTVAPDVPDDAFMAITHPAGDQPDNPVSYGKETLLPQCQDTSSYTIFAKRGTENKLLLYYYGGGACWDPLTCVAETCTQTANPTPPGLGGSGFADLTNPDNPFKDWHVVRIPYCTCDVHWGSQQVDYGPGLKTVEHRGYDNARFAEKWAREHFVSPTDVFLTGSSAGSYGALMGGMFVNDIYPASNMSVMGDAGNGVITQDFLVQNFENWGVILPDVPGIIDIPIPTLTMPAVVAAGANEFPATQWSNYSTAFDGGSGGQTGFYNVMLNDNDPLAALVWWEGSCQWNADMVQQAEDTFNAATAGNYRYYIASGSVHTGFGNPRVYADTTGGVPPLVDWVNGQIANDPNAWVNVEASPFNVLFPGQCSSGSTNPGATCDLNAQCPGGSCQGDDVKPDPLLDPFQHEDPNDSNSPVIVNCP
jgi:hypothetical protein